MKAKMDLLQISAALISITFVMVAQGSEPLLKRSKRFIWMKDRKLILPPGSTLIITPKLQIPFIRQPPEGLNSDIQISWPFYMFFDKLGMTGDSHPWPPPLFYPFTDFFFPRNITKKKEGEPRRKRAILSLPPPENIHGGERAVIVPRIENILNSFGMEGRACLLRAICEIHEFPLHDGYGLFGEIVTLLFSISSSSYAESHLPEYLSAEKKGKSGECTSYYKRCKKSLFIWEEKSKYSREMQSVRHSDFESNSINHKHNAAAEDDEDLVTIENNMESYKV